MAQENKKKAAERKGKGGRKAGKLQKELAPTQEAPLTASQ